MSTFFVVFLRQTSWNAFLDRSSMYQPLVDFFFFFFTHTCHAICVWTFCVHSFTQTLSAWWKAREECVKTQAACRIWTGFACTGLWVLLSIRSIRQIHCTQNRFLSSGYGMCWSWRAYDCRELLRSSRWVFNFFCLFWACFVLCSFLTYSEHAFLICVSINKYGQISGDWHSHITDTSYR